MDHVLAALVGVGLAASCGFRVFVPLLAVSIAARTGYLSVSESFAWLASWPALVALSIATVAEIGAFYIPWLDHALDAVASPAAVVAGTILFAATVTDVDPFLQWSLAIIAGGGSAAMVQGATVASRAASTTTTVGLGNFVVATLETLAGFFFSALSIVAPILAVALLAIGIAALYWIAFKILRPLWSRGQSTENTNQA